MGWNAGTRAAIRGVAAILVAAGVPVRAEPPLLVAARKAAEPEGSGLRPRSDSAAMPSLDLGRFSFTTPGEAAARGPRGSTIERSFRFTPSGKPESRALSVGISTRTAATGLETASPAVRSVVASGGGLPAGYEVDLALGWKGFSLSGGVSQHNGLVSLGPTEQLDVGLSFGSGRWRTGVTASAERGSPLLPHTLGSETDRYALGASGAIALSPALSLSGGVRYRTKPLNPSLLQTDKEEEAIYIGGALAF